MKFKFEIQNCIEIEIEAVNKDQARQKLINHPDLFSDKIIEDCTISEGIDA